MTGRVAALTAWWFLSFAPYSDHPANMVGPFRDEGDCQKVLAEVSKYVVPTYRRQTWCWWDGRHEGGYR